MARHTFNTHPLTRLAAGGSLLAAGAGVGTLGAALFAQSAGAAGATFVVNTLADPATPDPDNCTTPGLGDCSLREAIQAANIDLDADTITFDPSLSGTIVLGGSLDPLNGSLTVTGPGADTLSIEGNRSAFGFLQNPDFIGTPYAEDFRLEVSGLHLNGLNAPHSESPIHFGAIAVFSGDLIVRDVTVTDSASQVPGGGSYFVGGPISAGYLINDYNDDGLVNSATFERVTVTNNSSADQSDGQFGNSASITAIAKNIDLIDSTVTGNSATSVSAPFLWGANVNVSGTTITNNTSQELWSGLMVISGNCSISGSRIDHNSASEYAGLFVIAGWQGWENYGDGADRPCTISDTSVSYNTATLGSGSRLYANSPIELNRVTVVGNTSAPSGLQPLSGSPQATSPESYSTLTLRGDITINSSTIANNTGDAILLTGPNRAPTSASTMSTLSTLTNHQFVPRSNATTFDSILRISNSTISGNSGMGINAITTPNYQPTPENIVLDHALIHGNGAGANGDLNVPSTARFSLIGAASTPPVDGAGGGNLLGVDPGLQPLEWTSPFVGVVPILFGSAAWNTGDPSFTPPPATDQRGLPRVVDIVDIGAYEVQEAVLLPKFTG